MNPRRLEGGHRCLHCPYAPAVLVLWAAAPAASKHQARLCQVSSLHIAGPEAALYNKAYREMVQVDTDRVLIPLFAYIYLGSEARFLPSLYDACRSYYWYCFPEFRPRWLRENRVFASEHALISPSYGTTGPQNTHDACHGEQHLAQAGCRDEPFREFG